MDFDVLLMQVIELLQREKRVSYRALKRRFELDDDYLEDLKDELIYAKKLAIDEENRVLVFVAEPAPSPLPAPSTRKPTPPPTTEPAREPLSYTPLHLAEKILTSRSALEGERKQVTVFFCDLRHSTTIAEKIGAEAMHGLLSRFFELAMDDVHRYEGTVNQLLGDGFMALFGAPIAHEDHARRAVLAALDLQRTLRDSHAALGGQHGVELAFRMGLNTGMVVVGSVGNDLRLDYTAVGDTTNLAARLEQMAQPGDILVSESTSRLVQGYVRLEALEPVAVKGKTELVSLYKVLGTLPRRSPVVSRGERTLSTFVGRERELATLEEIFSQVVSGHGQVVGIVADAGGGKSRALYEFRRRLRDKQVTYLAGRCLSYGSTIPYYPLIDIVRHNCGIGETDSPDAITEKVRSALQEVGMDPQECSPYLLQLLGVKEGTASMAQLTPEAIRTRTFDTLNQMSLKGSQQRPLLFEIEDLHWIDNTSQDYLSSLVEDLAGASILLLTTYRPGYRPPWIEKSYATQIALRHLTPQDGVTVVQPVLHGERFPARLEQMILDKAEGNPFFLEELTHAVREHGGLQDDVTVPDTIQGVLSARIDRLPEEPKRLLQTAAVLGREFSPSLLKEIWEGSGALDRLLLDLKKLEFLFERTSAEEPIYVFKHALTQDVAYESLLTTRRQTLHAAAGQALEALYADRLEDASDRLAYHYARTDKAAKAVEYLTLAAEKAARGYAHVEAVRMLQEALVHTEGLPEHERDHSMVALAIRQAELAHAIPVLEDAVQQARQYRSRQVQSMSYCQLSEAYYHNGNIEKAQEVACQGLALAKDIQYLWGIGSAQQLLGRIAHHRGNYAEAQSHSQDALEIFASIHSRFELARTHLDLASLAHTQGDHDTATTHLSTAYAWFKKLEIPKYVERTEHLARAYGVALTAVELEELTEGSS